MYILAFAIASVTPLLPHECHIDCNGWNGVAKNEFEVCIVAVDGTTFKTGVLLAPDSTPNIARDLLWGRLEANGWRGRTVGKGILVLEGSKKSPIKSVEFTSDGWKPAVRYVLKPPPK